MSLRSLPRPVAYLAETVVIALIYAATAKAGFLLAIPPGNVTVVWPPSGIALAAVLLLGYRAGGAVWLGSFVVNAWFLGTEVGASVPASAGMAAWIGMGST